MDRFRPILPPDGASWPRKGAPLLTIHDQRVGSVAELPQPGAHLLVVESQSPEDCTEVARLAGALRAKALVLAPPGLDLPPLDLGPAAPALTVARLPGNAVGLDLASGLFALDVYRAWVEQLHVVVHQAMAPPLAVLARHGVPGLGPLPWIAPRTFMPVRARERLHVLGLLGLEFRKRTKAEQALHQKGRTTLSRWRGQERVPPLATLLREKPVPSVRISVAENLDADRLRSAFERVRALAGRPLEWVAPGSSAHLRLVPASTPSNVTVQLHSTAPRSLGQWLPRRSALGVLDVHEAARSQPHALAFIGHALELATAMRDLAALLDLGVTCAGELAPLPDGVGDETHTPGAIREGAVNEALRLCRDRKAAAANLLGIPLKRLREWLGEAGSEEKAPT